MSLAVDVEIESTDTAVVATDLLDQQDKLSLEGFFTHCRVQVL
jgi:hypothetical protein